MTDQVVEIPVDSIDFDPLQPRRSMKGTVELAKNIQINGQLNPIHVRKKNGKRYEVWAGEMRLRAIRHLKWPTIQAIIQEPNDYVRIADNVARSDLSVLEKAEVLDKFFIKKYGLKYEKILKNVVGTDKDTLDDAEKNIFNDCRGLGFSPMYVAQIIHLARIDEQTKRLILKSEKTWTLQVLNKLMRLSNADLRIRAAQTIIEKDYSSRVASDYVSSQSQHESWFTERNARYMYNKIKRSLDSAVHHMQRMKAENKFNILDESEIKEINDDIKRLKEMMMYANSNSARNLDRK